MWRKIDGRVTVPLVGNFYAGAAIERSLVADGPEMNEVALLYDDRKRTGKIAVTERSTVSESSEATEDSPAIRGVRIPLYGGGAGGGA